MTDDLPDMAAAELALGLLEGDERAAALRRLLAEPDFAGDVEHWRAHFAALFAAVPEVMPGDALLPRIEQRIEQERGARPVDAAVTPAQRRWAWPSIAALTSIAAAVLLVLLINRPLPTVVTPTPRAPALLAAAIVPVERGEPMSAVYDPAHGTLRLTAAALADARHSAELWVIGGDGVPHSLGLLRGGATTVVAVAPADRSRLAAAAVLAVSIEPIGGSPSALPTGPVVAKGTLAQT